MLSIEGGPWAGLYSLGYNLGFGAPEYQNTFLDFYLDLFEVAGWFAWVEGGQLRYPSVGIGFAMFTDSDGDLAVNTPDGTWGGVMFDDIELRHTYPDGSFDVVDVKETGILDPGQMETLTLFWNDTAYCNWCVVADVNHPEDADTSNDQCCMQTHVVTTEPTGDFTSMDICEGESLWHLCSTRPPMDDNHYWCGDETTGFYLPGMDDSLIGTVNLSNPPATGWILGFDTYYKFFNGPIGPHIGDFGEIYVRKSASDVWNKLGKLTGSADWHQVLYSIGPEFCGDESQIRFRMVSDEYEPPWGAGGNHPITGKSEDEGWYIDDVGIFEPLLDHNIFCCDFEDPQLPAGWTVVNHHGLTDGWMIETYQSGSYSMYHEPPPVTDPPYGGYFAACNSDDYSAQIDSSLFSPTIDLTGETDVWVVYDRNFQAYASGDYFHVNTSSYDTGLSTWVFEENLFTKTTDDPTAGVQNANHWFDPSGYTNPAMVKLEFHYSTTSGSFEWGVGIDNVKIMSNLVIIPPGIPVSWTIHNNGDDYWMGYNSATYAHSGTWLARCHWDYPPPNDDWLVTPGITLAAGGKFGFWARAQYTYDDETFEVWYSTTGSTVGDFLVTGTQLQAETSVDTTYTYFEYDIPEAAGTTVWCAIRYTGDYYWYLCVDDVLLPDGTIEGFEGATLGNVLWGPETFGFPYACNGWYAINTNNVPNNAGYPEFWGEIYDPSGAVPPNENRCAFVSYAHNTVPQYEQLWSAPVVGLGGMIPIVSFDHYNYDSGSYDCDNWLMADTPSGLQTVTRLSDHDNFWDYTEYWVLPSDVTQVMFLRTSSEAYAPWLLDDVCVDAYTTGAVHCLDTFESFGCFVWNASATCAGDFWEFTTSQPWGIAGDADGDGWNWFCHGYPAHGKGLNDVLYSQINLTDPELIYAEFEFAYSFYTEDGCAAYFEVSPDWDGTSDIESATWIPYWVWISSGYWTSGGWFTESFDLSEYIGNMIYIRFRYTTPGNDLFTAFPPNNGFAVDGFNLHTKKITFKDETPPVTTLVFDELTGTVSLFAYDPTGPVSSGVCNTFYKLDGGAQTEYVGPITLSEGAHTVEYWSVDCAGNEESHKNSPTLVVDTTPPTIEITEPIEGLYLFGSKILQSRILGSGALCIGKITIKANAADTGSGIKLVTFDVDGDSGYDASAPYEYLYRGPKFGSATVTATAYDMGGLEAQDSATFTIYSLGIL
jgi:hypothetical protein